MARGTAEEKQSRQGNQVAANSNGAEAAEEEPEAFFLSPKSDESYSPLVAPQPRVGHS